MSDIVTTEVRPYTIEIPDADLEDLRRRLEHTRLPSALPDAGWQDGMDPTALEGLVDRWLHDYDWRAVERQLNRFPQIITTIDGQDIHAVVVRSERADAIPLMLVHGWPSTFAEFVKVIDQLASPRDPDTPAFHVVVPSLPGYGFSGPTNERGWNSTRVAPAFAELMRRLGFSRYVPHGADIGFHVASDMAIADPENVAAIHLNLGGVSQARKHLQEPTRTPQEAHAKERSTQYSTDKSGYAFLQSTRPQTLAYLVTDSPVAQLAWVGEKFHEWTDPDNPVSADDVLTAASIYWLTRTAGSAARFYQDGYGAKMPPRGFVTTPTGVSVWPHDIVPALRHWTEDDYNVTYWADMPAGGHFAALEVPDLLIGTLRDFARSRLP